MEKEDRIEKEIFPFVPELDSVAYFKLVNIKNNPRTRKEILDQIIPEEYQTKELLDFYRIDY